MFGFNSSLNKSSIYFFICFENMFDYFKAHAERCQSIEILEVILFVKSGRIWVVGTFDMIGVSIVNYLRWSLRKQFFLLLKSEQNKPLQSIFSCD